MSQPQCPACKDSNPKLIGLQGSIFAGDAIRVLMRCRRCQKVFEADIPKNPKEADPDIGERRTEDRDRNHGGVRDETDAEGSLP